MEVQHLINTIGSSSSTIDISWFGPENQQMYKVKYREVESVEKTFEDVQTYESQITIRNLKCKTLYEIKVFIENNDGSESLYFKTKEKTMESSAIWLTNMADKITDDPIPVYQLRAAIEKKVENDKEIKVYKYFPETKNVEERTMLVVGASGSGKSTLINAMVNFIADVSFAERFRLKIVDDADQSSIISKTKYVTCYKLRWQNGFRIGYNLNIVEVPGFDGTAQKEGNYSYIIQQLIDLLESGEVPFINAACLVVPLLCRLTDEQRCIFRNILSIFGKNIDSVIPMITFDDGGDTSVLTSLEKANVPCSENLFFRFNNSMLNKYPESRAVWNSRESSMTNLFDKLPSMKNSVAETIKVLLSRKNLIMYIKQADDKRNEITDIKKTIDKYDASEVLQNNGRRYSLDINRQIECLICKNICNTDCSCITHFLFYLAWILKCCVTFCICPFCPYCVPTCACQELCCCFRIQCLQRMVGCHCHCAIAHHQVNNIERESVQQRNITENSNKNEFNNKIRDERMQTELELKCLLKELKDICYKIRIQQDILKSSALKLEPLEELKEYEEILFELQKYSE